MRPATRIGSSQSDHDDQFLPGLAPDSSEHFAAPFYPPSGPILYGDDLSGPALPPAPTSPAGGPGTGGTPSVTGPAGTGLIINVSYDTSVANAPAGFKTVVSSVVQYF